MINQKGFTLIELMISVALGLFIVLAAVTFYSDTRKAARYQESLTQMTEAGRSATVGMRRDFRGTDFWGCFNPDYGLTSFNNSLDPNGVNYVALDRGVGFVNNAGVNGSDSIVLTSGEYVSARIRSPYMADKAGDLTVTDGSQIAQNDILVVSDCKRADIFQVTNNPSAAANLAESTVSHGLGATASGPGNVSAQLSQAYGSQADIFKVSTAQWFVASQNGETALFRRKDNKAADLIAMNVEDIQIKFDIERGVTQGAVISLLIRSQNEVADNPSPYRYEGVVVTPTDRYLRKVITTSYAFRNRLK